MQAEQGREHGEGRLDDHKELYEMALSVVMSHGGVESISTAQTGFVQIAIALHTVCRGRPAGFIFYFFMPRSNIHDLEMDPRLQVYKPWFIE